MATRIRRTRIEELVKYQERLRQHQVVDIADESASARRILKDLTGVTSKEEMFKEMTVTGGRKCWRNWSLDQKQADATVSTLKKGLVKVRQEDYRARQTAYTGLTEEEFSMWRRKIRINIKALRAKESKRLKEREKHLVNRQKECKTHLVCKWIRKAWENSEKQTESKMSEEKRSEERVTVMNRKESDVRKVEEILKEREEVERKILEKNKEERGTNSKELRDKVVTIFGDVRLTSPSPRSRFYVI